MQMKAISPNFRAGKKAAPLKYSSDEDDPNDDISNIPIIKKKNEAEFLSDYSYDGSYYSDDDQTPVHINKVANNHTPVAIKTPIKPSPKPPNKPFIGAKRPMPISRPLPQKNKPQQSPKPQSDDYEYSEEYSEGYSYEQEEIKPQETQQEVKPNPSSRRISRPDTNSHQNQKDSQSHQNQNENQPQKIEFESSPQKIQQDVPMPSDRTDIQSRSKQQEIEPIDNQPQELQQNIISQQPEQPKPYPTDVQKSYIPPVAVQPQPVQAQNDEKSFQIVYEKNNIGNSWKRYVQMLQNDVIYYVCKSVKVPCVGKAHVICTKKPVDLFSPNFAGMIVRHQSGSRFTLYQKGGEIGQSNPQIAGIAFVNLKTDLKIRMFRVAIPTTDEPYIPADKSKDLSRIAYNNEENTPNVKIYSSAIPQRKKGGGLTLNFGNYQIIRSIKNFIVRDDNDTPVFVHFKTFGGICTLKIREPFTELIGFAVAVAISTSMK